LSLGRAVIAGSVGAGALAHRSARAQDSASAPTIRIGVLTDLSGSYRDAVGPTGVACVRQAVQEFTAGKDMRVEVVAADFQNKPDIGVGQSTTMVRSGRRRYDCGVWSIPRSLSPFPVWAAKRTR